MLQQRKKIRFNFIDVMIVLLIIAVIGTAVYLIMSDFRPTNKMIGGGNITICVRISNVDESGLELIRQAKNEGLDVKDSITGETIGTLIGYNAETKTKYYGKTAVENEDGIYVVPSTEYENKYEVKAYISVDAEMDERGIYTIAGNRILVGAPIHFKIPSFAAVSYIVEKTENSG